MKKNLSVLMFVIATILFISCEKDLYENAIKNEKRKATVSTVNLNDLSKSKGLYEKFITTKNRLSSVDSKLVYNSDFGFYIDTENMKLIEYNDYKTLTAQIYRSGYLGKFENLYIHQYPNGSFGAFIFDYNFSEQDIDKYILNQPIENLIDKTRFKAIDYANTVDYNGTVIPYNGACYTINNVFEDDEDGQVWVTLILCPGCECGSSDDVQIIPNDDSYGATFNYYYFNLPGMPDQYPGSGTPSGGGNSSTGSNGNPIITQPLINENKNEIKLINDYLNDDQDNWWYFTATPETKVDILNNVASNGSSGEAFQFANELINLAMNNSLVTPFPLFQYPLNSNYTILYPNFTVLVKEYIPSLKTDQRLINTIHKLTNVNIQTIIDKLTWGNGPEINIVQLGNDPQGNEYHGKFNITEPDKIFIDIDLVNQLEQMSNISNPTQQQQQQLEC
jgi:hypothetical protein